MSLILTDIATRQIHIMISSLGTLRLFPGERHDWKHTSHLIKLGLTQPCFLLCMMDSRLGFFHRGMTRTRSRTCIESS